MRVLELTIISLLFLGIVLTFLPKRSPKYQQHIPLLLTGITMVHLAIEGYRWQMVPAYILMGLLWLVYRRGAKRTIEVVWRLGLSGWFVVSLVPPIAMPVFDLPTPTGPYAIGTVTFHWVDSTRLEWFTEDPDDRRELVVQIGYPGTPPDEAQPVSYMDHVDLRGPALAEQANLPSFILGHLGLIRTHAYPDIPVSEDLERYPVLVLSHGLGGARYLHTALIEELVSHGYMVIAPDHTYDCNMTIFPDGRIAEYKSYISPEVTNEDSARIRRQQLATRVADVRFVGNQAERLNTGSIESPLTGKLDMDRMGVLGHSFGGSTGIQVSKDDDRFKACLALDSWTLVVPETTVESGLDQPFLYVGRSAWPDSRNDRRLTSLISHNRGDQTRISIEGSHHFDYTDTPLLSPFLSLIGMSGSVPGKRMVKIVNSYVLAFFDRHLKEKPSPLLNGESPDGEVEAN